MKTIQKLPAVLLVLFLSFSMACAQDSSLSKTYKQEVITKLSQLMNDFYVFPEVAKQTSAHLQSQLEAGYFDAFDTNETFAQALTESVQTINKDKHMRIRTTPPYVAPENTPERMVEEHLNRRDRSRWYNGGFVEAKVLQGNVGYIDLRGFAGLENAQAIADAAMEIVARADAIIIDLSQNGGGSPRMVQYLCSYFFDDHRHLNSLYWREGDVTEEFWTLDTVNGTKLPEIPLYVITGSRTFSGAEEFSYNMQTQKRATLVGQTTGGGANPGGTMAINENLNVFIPSGRAINPITNTNWEGVGVVPEVKTTPEEAYDTTYQLAIEAAETYRTQQNKKFGELLLGLNQQLENYQKEGSEKAVLKSLKTCIEANLLNEGDINALGYTYLLERQEPKTAECIFKANTQLFPNSANVFDSYAECLMQTGALKAALKNYEKAVEIASKNQEPNLDLFKENLQTLKDKIKSKN